MQRLLEEAAPTPVAGPEAGSRKPREFYVNIRSPTRSQAGAACPHRDTGRAPARVILATLIKAKLR